MAGPAGRLLRIGLVTPMPAAARPAAGLFAAALYRR
jgi:hypothetical protein